MIAHYSTRKDMKHDIKVKGMSIYTSKTCTSLLAFSSAPVCFTAVTRLDMTFTHRIIFQSWDFMSSDTLTRNKSDLVG